MVCLRFSIFLLGFLFVTTSLRNSIASHHQDQDRDADEVVVMRNAFSHTLMDSNDGAKSTYLRKLMFGGKSMSAQKSSNADTEDENAMKSTTVTQKTSGETCDHVKKSVGILTGYKNQEPKALESTSFLTPRSSSRPQATITRLKHGKHLKTMSAKASFRNTSRKSARRKEVNQFSTPTSEKDESEKLLEAEKEIVGLMRRDYKGMGWRKPPVHNSQPRN